MLNKFRGLAIVGIAVLGTACADMLEVNNKNSPEQERVYASPAGAEAVVAGLFTSFHNATTGDEGLKIQSAALALESYGQVANFGMQLRGGYPRIPISNQRGNQVLAGNNNNWQNLSRLIRNAVTGVKALDRINAEGGVFGTNNEYQRDRAFGFFVIGLATGTLALGYDSVAVATVATPASDIPNLIPAAEAMDTAFRMLDSAIAIAGGGFVDIPGSWLGQPTGTVTPARFIQIARSYKAKFRAGLARTPSDVVNWDLVEADAAAGITTDMQIQLGGGWNGNQMTGQMQTSNSWHQVSLVYIGMADTSGAYQAMMAPASWSAKNGMSVLVQTPDTRWPTGSTRAAQNADTAVAGTTPAGQYINNRLPAVDQPDLTNTYGTSQYDHRRWRFISNASGVGIYVYVPAAEIRMLEAEAKLKKAAPDVAGAVALINASRAAHGLAPIGLTGATGAPGSGTCVPRMPDGSCGSVLEAMKYEKRMETQMIGYMNWFTDSRRWGDLIIGTPVEWPVPYQEMDTRNLPFKDGTRLATVNTFGW